jgi:hypothetical protein
LGPRRERGGGAEVSSRHSTTRRLYLTEAGQKGFGEGMQVLGRVWGWRGKGARNS